VTHPRPESRTLLPRSQMVSSVLICLALYGLALVPRLAGSARESLWWDEYTSVVHLDAPSLTEFLRLNRTLDPATLPLYYTLEYLWWQHVSAGGFSLRLLSALLNALAAPLLYLIVRPRAGRAGGVIAALCFIFSPVQAQHGMGIRMYALFVPLATLSMWAWLASLDASSHITDRKRQRALLVWAASTLALSWTHPFAPLLAMAQGIHLFFARPNAVRLWTRRGFLMAVLTAPSLIYAALVRFWPRETTETWMRKPNPFLLLADILWDDVPRWTWQMDWGAWGRALDTVTRMPITGMTGILYALGAAGLTGWFLIFLLRRVGTPDFRFFVGLILTWLVLPPLTLYGLSLLWRPCMMPRYTVHAALALYALCGMAFGTVSGKSARTAAAALFAGLMLCALLTRPGPWRTDWRGAARLLSREALPAVDTLVVVNHTWRDVFLLNVRLDPEIRSWTLPTAAAETPDALQAVINWWQYRQTQTAHPDPAPSLWVLAAGPYFSNSPPEAVDAVLRKAGAPAPCARFETVEPLWLWRLRVNRTPDTASGEDLIPRDTAADLEHETMHALGDYALAQGLAGRTEEASALLRALQARSAFAGELYEGTVRALESGNPDDLRQAGRAVRKMWDSYGYLKNRREDLAREGFTTAAQLDPRNGLACLEAGLLVAAVRPDEARALLEEAVFRHSDYGPLTRRLRETLAVGDKKSLVSKALAATRTFRHGLAAIGQGDATHAVQLLRKTLELDPEFTEALPPLAYAQTLSGDLEGAWATLDACDRAGLERDPNILGNRALVALMRGDLQGAEHWYRQITAASPDLAAKYDGLFRALFEGNRDRARAEIKKLDAQGIPVPPPIREILEKHENKAY